MQEGLLFYALARAIVEGGGRGVGVYKIRPEFLSGSASACSIRLLSPVPPLTLTGALPALPMTMTYMMNASRFGGVPYSASPKVFLDVSKDIKYKVRYSQDAPPHQEASVVLILGAISYALPVAAADEASIIAPLSSRRITSSSFNSILSCQVADSTVCCIASPERPYVCPRI